LMQTMDGGATICQSPQPCNPLEPLRITLALEVMTSPGLKRRRLSGIST